MDNMLAQSTSNVSSSLPEIKLSEIPKVALKMILTGTFIGGLYWLGRQVDYYCYAYPNHSPLFEERTLSKILFVGLLPAVNQTSLAILNKYTPYPELNKDSAIAAKQLKARKLIVTSVAMFCTPFLNTLLYNLCVSNFATQYGLKTWQTSDIFERQLNALGKSMILFASLQTILIASGVSKDEINQLMGKAEAKQKTEPKSQNEKLLSAG